MARSFTQEIFGGKENWGVITTLHLEKDILIGIGEMSAEFSRGIDIPPFPRSPVFELPCYLTSLYSTVDPLEWAV
jgi:hypothetical protein